MKSLIISIVALVISVIALLQTLDTKESQEIKGLSCHRCGSSKVVTYNVTGEKEFIYVCQNCNFVVKR